MRIYEYASSNGSRIGFLNQADATSKLPQGGLSWEYLGELEIKEDDPKSLGRRAKLIIGAVKADGIYLWPERSDAQRP